MAEDANPVIGPPTLTVTQYQLLANEFSASLDKVASLVPKPDPAHAVTESFVNARLGYPIEFLGTVIASVEQALELQATGKLDPKVGRDTLQLYDAFRPVLDKIERFKKDLLTNLNVRLAVLTEEALQVYVVAQTFARDKKSPTLAAFVANMKRDLGRAEARRRFAAKKAADKAAAEKTAVDKAAAEKAAAEKPGVKAATSTSAS
ncbi:MAG: hypothetical protein DMF56_06200 [Acidobacteria bacterium]|nr:MAG: hypothetical protein DMF56_06200 [Acidobacteriota bacterium]